MLKRFAITLIILSTLVYGSVFFLSMHYHTGFFDEILIQMTRMDAGFFNKAEVRQSKQVLKTIIENEHPPENWPGMIFKPGDNNAEQLFYHYKVWVTKTQVTLADVKGSYPIFKSKEDKAILINMRYGNKKPVLQFPFYKTGSGKLLTGLFFPINELPFDADLNKDHIIDQKDVLIARKG